VAKNLSIVWNRFFMRSRFLFHHAVWQLFVMAGNGCHLMAVLGSVIALPGPFDGFSRRFRTAVGTSPSGTAFTRERTYASSEPWLSPST